MTAGHSAVTYNQTLIEQYTVPAADGSGTMTVSPTSVNTLASQQTFTFTYTAASGGTSSGTITVQVPAGWTAPQGTSGTAGYTTSTCGGTPSFTGTGPWTVIVGGVTVAGAATCSITYGSGGGTSGVTAPVTPGTATFTTQEESTSTGTLTTIATSPTVTVNSVLSISPPSSVSLGTTIAAGSTVSNVALGSVSYTNTMNDGLAWSVTLAATDLFNATGPKTVPFTNFKITVGQTVSPAGPTPTAAGPTALGGGDSQPGTTYSGFLALVNGTSTQNGTYSQTGDAVTVTFPANQINSGTMTSTIQYTLTG